MIRTILVLISVGWVPSERGRPKEERLMLDLCKYSVDWLIEDGVNSTQFAASIFLGSTCKGLLGG